MYVNSAVPALCGIVASCGTSLILDLEKCIDMLVEFCKKRKSNYGNVSQLCHKVQEPWYSHTCILLLIWHRNRDCKNTRACTSVLHVEKLKVWTSDNSKRRIRRRLNARITAHLTRGLGRLCNPSQRLDIRDLEVKWKNVIWGGGYMYVNTTVGTWIYQRHFFWLTSLGDKELRPRFVIGGQGARTVIPWRMLRALNIQWRMFSAPLTFNEEC
jgi:hypothetical protein